jgi:hypothetical protein
MSAAVHVYTDIPPYRAITTRPVPLTHWVPPHNTHTRTTLTHTLSPFVTLLMRPLIDFFRASHVMRWYSLDDWSVTFFCMAARRAGGMYVPPVRVLVAHHSSSSLVVPPGRSGWSSGMPSRSRLRGRRLSAWRKETHGKLAHTHRSRSSWKARCRCCARSGSRSRNAGPASSRRRAAPPSRSTSRARSPSRSRSRSRSRPRLRLPLRLRLRRRRGLGDRRDLDVRTQRVSTACVWACGARK